MGGTQQTANICLLYTSFGNRIIAITNNGNSTLAKNADAVMELHMANETCPNNLAPTTSTTLKMAIGDALAIAMIRQRTFMPNDFARYHPGGSLGRRLLTRVADVMQHDVPAVSYTHLDVYKRQVVDVDGVNLSELINKVSENGYLLRVVDKSDQHATSTPPCLLYTSRCV